MALITSLPFPNCPIFLACFLFSSSTWQASASCDFSIVGYSANDLTSIDKLINLFESLHDRHGKSVSVGDECKKRRRELLVQAAASVFAFPAISAAALAAESGKGFRVYTDEVNKFKITIPEDWQVVKLRMRRLASRHGRRRRSEGTNCFLPTGGLQFKWYVSTEGLSIAITGLGADFTRLESFGKVGEFAETLIGGLDRSWQRPPGVAAKLIDSRASNGLYYIEYTLKNPGESGRHLYSVLGVANNGIYNRLYTLTGQFVDEEEEKFGPKIQKAVSSFRLS
ncbi:hypothetical protein SASPL_113311 [Salvia splendens]|uniref:PsbP C-terminal domain-containing protein n=1 Tax=Salvia splendens TaxID=180675 RepID=A0A8X8Y1F4_SALSN|nr:hypothetical protein SASPL_113311 [Salvia splendens]